MRIQHGAIVVSTAGKLGGHVSQGSPAGPILRQGIKPRQYFNPGPNLTRQRKMRVAQAWRRLTQAQRDQWLRTKIEGYQGFELYSVINFRRLQMGQPLRTVPSVYTVPPSLGNFALLIDVSSNVLRVSWPIPLPLGYRVQCQGTRPTGRGVNQRHSGWQQWMFQQTPGTVQLNAVGNYQTRNGALRVGTKIFVRVRVIETTGAYAGPWSELSAIVVP